MSSTERTRGTSIVLLVLAAVVAVIGFVNAAGGPTCGSDAMSPGDTCWIDGVRSSYADRVAAARSAPLVNGLIALVLVGCAVGCWPRSDRGQTRQATPRAANGAAGAGAARGAPGRGVGAGGAAGGGVGAGGVGAGGAGAGGAGAGGAAGVGAGGVGAGAAGAGGVGGRGAAAGGTTTTTALPLARTPAEAHLAMSLQPCACGAADIPRESALFRLPEGFVRRYSGACPSCGRPREFTFRLLDEPPVAEPGGARYGDGTPSELIDPGVWLAVADQFARRTPGDATGLDAAARRAARKDIAWAAAAVDEVIAFIPRGGAAVPAGAFTSEAGRRIRDREPGRFGRARLEAVRDTYRQIAAELADPQPDRAT